MKISRAEAKSFKRRWKKINLTEKRELRKTPLSLKIIHLAALMASAKTLNWDKVFSNEQEETRMRWSRLKKTYHVR